MTSNKSQTVSPRGTHKHNGQGQFAPRESVQDRLKSIGQRVAALQELLSGAPSTDTSRLERAVPEAWTLLLELRPFLFLACDPSSPHAEASSSVASAYRTHERKRDLHHVSLALRLYNTLARMTIGIPHTTLHACLTLLALLPQLSVNFGAAGSDAERYVDGLRHHLLCLAAVDATAFATLVKELLDKLMPFVSPGVQSTVLSRYPFARHAHGMGSPCSLRVCPLDADQLETLAASLSFTSTDDAEALFASQVVIATPQDYAASAQALASLFTTLATDNTLTWTTGDPSAVTPLVDLGYQLVDEGCEEEEGQRTHAGQKRDREDGTTAADLASQRQESHRSGSGRSGPNQRDLQTIGLALLRALAEATLLRTSAHGTIVLRTVLRLCATAQHQICTRNSCTLDSAKFLVDVLLSPTDGAENGLGVLLLSGTTQSPLDAFLLTTWLETLFNQHAYLRKQTCHTAPTEQDGALPLCVEHVYRLQQLLQAAMSSGPAAPSTLDALGPCASRISAHLASLSNSLCGVVPVQWYETAERGDGTACPEQELWAFVPFGAQSFLAALVGSLTQLKETLSVSHFQLAKAQAYAIASLLFQREMASGGGEDDDTPADLTEWLRPQLNTLAASAVSSASATDFPIRFTEVVADVVHVLLQHPEPELTPLFHALILVMRIGRQKERRDVLDKAALTVLQAVDEHVTKHKSAITRAAPWTWRALLRAVSWNLPTPLAPHTAAVTGSPGDPKQDEERDHEEDHSSNLSSDLTAPLTSHSSGVLRHFLVLLRRCPASHVSVHRACVTGLLRGLSSRTTQILTVLAEATDLSLAALYHQSASGPAGDDVARVNRVNRELRCCAGSLAVLLQDAQPLLALLVQLSQSPLAGVPALEEEEEESASLQDTSATTAAAASGALLPDGALPFLVSLTGVVLLAREWVLQAPTVAPLFLAAAQEEPFGSRRNTGTTIVDVDDDDDNVGDHNSNNSDSELAVVNNKIEAASGSPYIGQFPTCVVDLARDGISALTTRLSTSSLSSTSEQRVELSALLACLVALAPNDDRGDAILTSDEVVCDDSSNKANGLASLVALALCTALQQREQLPEGFRTLVFLDRPSETETEAQTERQRWQLVALLFSGAGAAAVATRVVRQLAPKVSVPALTQSSDALTECLSLPAHPNRQRSTGWERWAERLLTICAAAWPSPGLPLPVSMDLRVPLLDAATAVLRSLSWRPEDLLRRAPDMVTSAFFAILCTRFDGASPGTSLRTAMDLIVPKLIFHSAWSITDVEQAVAQLESLAAGPVANACLEPTLAHVLLQHGTSAPAALTDLRRLFEYLQLDVKDLPNITVSCVPLTVLNLLSLAGDSQLRLWRERESRLSTSASVGAQDASNDRVRCAVDSVPYSFLELALRQVISLTEAAASVKDVQLALDRPLSTQVASQAMVTHSFDVLDRLMKCMGVTLTQSTIESPVPQLRMSPVVSVHTGCRWLLALASFLRFLGPHTTLMMAKLPPILETCCTQASLVRVACAVWREMIQQCTDAYLREHAATIVVDLVALELYAAAMDDVALATLASAIARVHAKSSEAPFWQSYFKVLGGLSRLVASVQPRQVLATPAGTTAGKTPPPPARGRGGRNSARKTTAQEAQTPQPDGRASASHIDTAAANADAIASGFSFIMNSSSSKCKAIFVRALHRFLSEADETVLHEVTKAAATHPQLIPTLLQCSRELEPADVLDALSCVGMIGAVAPQTVSRSTTSADSKDGAPPRDAGEPRRVGEAGASRLQVGTVLQWRVLAYVLLSEYCTRALANTSDPAIYDRAGYAVQELLLLFARRERTASNGPPLLKGDVLHVDELERYNWWHDLDTHSKQLLEGFTTTRYAAHRHTPSEPSYPAYHAGMPYSHWLHAFFKSLSPQCDTKFSQMMAALRNVSRRDLTLVTFLIPHMIANILENAVDGSRESAVAVDVVVQEIDCLLNAAIHGADHGGGSNSNDVLSLRSQSALESNAVTSVTPPTLRVDEHVQFILGVLEDLQRVRWSLLRIGRRLEAPPRGEPVSEEMCLKLADQYRDFLGRVRASKKALAAIEIGSNMRALRCLESQGRLHSAADESKEVPLQRIFAALGDRDSAKSIHRLMHGLLPEKAAFSYENSGEWQQAIQNCELVLQHKPHSVAHQFTALRCMRQLGQLHFMSRYAQSLLEEAKQQQQQGTHSRAVDSVVSRAASVVGSTGRRSRGAATTTVTATTPKTATSKAAVLPDSIATLQNYANEAAWRLGEWDKVECADELPASLAAPVAQWVKLLHGKAAPEAVARATHMQRCKLAPIVQRTCRENYSQCYPYVVMLHTLADLDGASKQLQSGGGTSSDAWNEGTQRLLIDTLNARLQVTDVSLEAREPMLSLHRAIYTALGLSAEVSTTWLEHARLLRDAGFPEAALIAARQSFLAAPNTQPSYYTLAAELLYEMKAPMQAVEFVSEHVSDPHLPPALRSDLQVMMTNWRLETGSQSKDEVIGSYRTALEFQDTEKGHHHLALFLDKLYMVNVDNVETEMKGVRETDKVALELYNAKLMQLIEDYAVPAVSQYADALLDGHDTVSVSLPRLLTLWLDSTVKLTEMKRLAPRSAIDAERLLKTLNRAMESFLFDKSRSVAPQVLVTALPQLLSRLGHPCPQVVPIITRAVVLLMTHFPQPCLWMVMPIAFSKQARRMSVVKQNIIPPFVAADPGHKQILQNVFDIFVALIELCNCPASTFANNAKLTAQPFIQKVESVLENAHFIVPTMATLSPCITASELSEVFPSSPTFLRFDDRVDVMSSLQKPKRVWVHTSEGTVVSFLCKSRDEPRKDIRMMEVASLMNTFFLKDPAARRRNFSLRRYAIAALTDDCALIEWVNNISTLRNVATQCYGLDGTGVRISQVKAWQAKVDNKTLSKLDMFKKHILPTAPPVLHQWFDATFATNDQWYQARNLFTQSTALWSIAGHIVGLGDRHGENLMIDMQRGEMLHVDFACLFDKGETLDVPERVRFRLTQNIVDGMGVLGTEGQFRANCEIALRCQMQNKNAVMSIVETLLHDPLVEWTQKTGRPSVNPNRLIQRVSRRLDGFLDLYTVPPENDTMALNVQGQVSKLISHSSAIENLCEMYIWWMAWL